MLYTSLDCANFSSNIYDLHIRNATIDILDVSEVKWKNLKSLSITDGQINRVEGQFLNDTKISCLNLSNNALTDIENNFMSQLNYLKHLDLSYNNITHLPALNEKLHTLDISGINTISCTEIASTIDTNKNYSRWLSFIHRNKSVCSAYSNYVWFNETEQLSLEELRNIGNLLSKCPRGENWHCKCNFNRMVLFANNVSVRTVDVDCSNNNLTELPKELPPYTVTLTVTNNRIEKLDEIITNPSYHYLQNLYADYNEISSINILEGSKFANTFYSLSLRFNKLIPTYILVPKQYNDSDEVNSFIKLGGNEVFCDCYAARYLKDWLLLNVIDDDQVYCKNCLDRVVDLNVKQMCKFNNDLTDYIYCIITIEVILLVTVLTKFFFDYWYYKKEGKLPWFSKVIPKSRFDWFFEIHL
ncbi:protein halfway-like [Microplitis mediator]|uniref:protein halfway-like n=1 Tax=Microplitis mediator TaxID=375433 RepID=UPI002552A43D|nr:protein halfway-like [Microplitis mediator]